MILKTNKIKPNTTKKTFLPCANITIFLYYSNSQRPRTACWTWHPPSKPVFSPEEVTTQIDQRDSRQGSTEHRSSCQHLSVPEDCSLTFSAGDEQHLSHSEMPFSFWFCLTRSAQKASESPRAQSCSPSAHPHCIRVIPFIFCGTGQWTTHVCLFKQSTLPHSLILSRSYWSSEEVTSIYMTENWKGQCCIAQCNHSGGTPATEMPFLLSDDKGHRAQQETKQHNHVFKN